MVLTKKKKNQATRNAPAGRLIILAGMCPSMCPRVPPIARKEMSKMRPTTCARNPRRTSNQTLIDGWSFVDFKTQRESGRFGFQNAESTRSPPGRQAGRQTRELPKSLFQSEHTKPERMCIPVAKNATSTPPCTTASSTQRQRTSSGSSSKRGSDKLPSPLKLLCKFSSLPKFAHFHLGSVSAASD